MLCFLQVLEQSPAEVSGASIGAGTADWKQQQLRAGASEREQVSSTDERIRTPNSNGQQLLGRSAAACLEQHDRLSPSSSV